MKLAPGPAKCFCVTLGGIIMAGPAGTPAARRREDALAQPPDDPAQRGPRVSIIEAARAAAEARRASDAERRREALRQAVEILLVDAGGVPQDARFAPSAKDELVLVMILPAEALQFSLARGGGQLRVWGRDPRLPPTKDPHWQNVDHLADLAELDLQPPDVQPPDVQPPGVASKRRWAIAKRRA